ncbi:MAG: amidohydrolase [Desulfobacteraceae bacterium]|nr:MAG: amidohydrolase [Desulfobacteraceae bacterium]
MVDFHTHIFPPLFRNERGRFFAGEPGFKLLYDQPKSTLIGAEDLLRQMDQEGVQRSVVFGFPWEKSDHFRRHNDYILESVARYPDRFSGLSCFSPLSSLALMEAERCLEQGLCGIGELAVYHEGSMARAFRQLGEVASFCAGRNAILLLHTNESVGKHYPGKASAGVGEFYALLKDHPATRFVLAHWGGGLFFYALMKKEVKETLRNTWFDTAATPYLYVPDIYRIAGEIVGFERILFGSDFPLIRPGRYFSEMESAAIPEEALRMIKGENGARLLSLPL